MLKLKAMNKGESLNTSSVYFRGPSALDRIRCEDLMHQYLNMKMPPDRLRVRFLSDCDMGYPFTAKTVGWAVYWDETPEFNELGEVSP